MQNSNDLFDLLGDFLKSNNLNSDDILEKIFYKNNQSYKEDFKEEKLREPIRDLGGEDDYELLINKLNSIKKNMTELSKHIKNKID
tara:strand:- start:166 stop:423 length:258 start_codon:yes stop_codon:yes gene_type:complete